MKICPVGVELFQGDGQPNMKKLIVALSNFANASKNSLFVTFNLLAPEFGV